MERWLEEDEMLRNKFFNLACTRWRSDKRCESDGRKWNKNCEISSLMRRHLIKVMQRIFLFHGWMDIFIHIFEGFLHYLIFIELLVRFIAFYFHHFIIPSDMDEIMSMLDTSILDAAQWSSALSLKALNHWLEDISGPKFLNQTFVLTRGEVIKYPEFSKHEDSKSDA